MVFWETSNRVVLGANPSPTPVSRNRIESSISLKKEVVLFRELELRAVLRSLSEADLREVRAESF